MENALRMVLLYDFYGSLLTGRQQHVFKMYFHEDLSLGEIGEELKVSRQAIHDILKRTGIILEDLESKLKLINKHQERQLLYKNLLNLIELSQKKDPDQIMVYLKNIETVVLEAKTLG